MWDSYFLRPCRWLLQTTPACMMPPDWSNHNRLAFRCVPMGKVIVHRPKSFKTDYIRQTNSGGCSRTQELQCCPVWRFGSCLPGFRWTILEPSPATGVENGSQCFQLTCGLLRRRSRLDRIRPSLRTAWWEMVWGSWVRWEVKHDVSPHTGASWYGLSQHFASLVLWQQ